MRHIFYIICVLSICTNLFARDITRENRETNSGTITYQFGVFPYLPTTNIETIYAPIAKQFSEVLSNSFRLSTRLDFEAFRNSVEEEFYDIIYIQPFGYIRAAAPHNYIPIARFVASGDTQHTGMMTALFVTLDSMESDDIKQIKGKIIAMPPIDAAVSFLGKAYIKKSGINFSNDLEIKYMRNHFSCLQQLLINRAYACVTAISALSVFESENNVKFRLIALTSNIPSALFAVHIRVPNQVREKLRFDILNWHKNATGKRLLKRTKYIAFISTTEADYAPVKRMWKDLSRDFE